MATTTEVYIVGPNLWDQSKGQFRIHRAGCGHIDRMKRRDSAYEDGWSVEAESRRQVVEAVYGDQMSEGASYESCRADLYFEPCLADLPEENVMTTTEYCRYCGRSIHRADDGAYEDESGACGCGDALDAGADGEHEPDAEGPDVEGS